MPRGPRTRIATQCYEDASGRACIVRDPRTGKPKEFRHPPRTPISIMRKAASDWLATRTGSKRAVAVRGTLNDAINRLEQSEQHLVSWGERRAELRAWADRVGTKRLDAITDQDCREAISAWAQAGLAPKTIRNRLWSLKHLYRVFGGKRADTPLDDIDPPKIPRRVINPTPDAVILAVYAKLLEHEQRGILRDAKTRARFMVRAATGRRPSEIMRAQPADVDLVRRIWRVRDGKGGWSEGLYLNDDAVIAWRVFHEANAWGQFHTGSHAQALRCAGWPSDRDARGRFVSRPYNLRHSTGIKLSELGVDLEDVGAWLGQKDTRTTRTNYVPVLGGRMQRAAELLEGRFRGWSVPSTVPSAAVEMRGFPGRNHPSGPSAQDPQTTPNPEETQ